MKNLILAPLLLFMALTGCKTVTAPLPAQAVDQIDATANTILQPAHAFAADISASVLSTDPQKHIDLTATQTSVLVKLNQALNIADPLEQAYHANPTSATSAQLQSADQQVSTALSAAQTAIPIPGK